MNLGLIAVGFAVLVLAGMVKGVIGMGLPTVGIGLLSVFLAPAEAAALILPPPSPISGNTTGPNVLGIARRFFWMMVMVRPARSSAAFSWAASLGRRAAGARCNAAGLWRAGSSRCN